MSGVGDGDRFLADVYAAMFGDCLDHEHEQIGPCVYCRDCGRRLYQGGVMSTAELGVIRELINSGGDQ